MSEKELPREVSAALKALDQAESLAAEYAALRGEDDEVAATKIRAVAMNLERWARRDVRREALEEAAKVAEQLAGELVRLKGSGDRRVQIGSHLETCATIAASIRALSQKE